MISVLSPEMESKQLPFGQKFPEPVGGGGEEEGGGGKEEAGTKQIFPVSSTKVARDLGTPGRKRRGNLEKLRLILRGVQNCRFCSYKLTHSLLLPVTSAFFSPPSPTSQSSGLGAW